MYDIAIGDLESDLSKLERIVSKYPSSKLLFLGDFIDRNLDTKEVLDIIMNHSAIKGNHEDSFVNDFYYSNNLLNQIEYLLNGGDKTILSFLPNQKEKNRFFFYLDYLTNLFQETRDLTMDNDLKNTPIYKKDPSIIKDSSNFLSDIKKNIDIKYINFIEELPLFIETESYLLSHNLLDKQYNSYKEAFTKDPIYVWRKQVKLKERDKFQIFGHYNYDEFKYFYNKDNIPFALCLDSSKGNKIAIYDFNKKIALNI